jgi:DNA-binding CsgD family transcriptional regulator
MPVLLSPLHVAGALAATLASTLAGAVAGQGALVLVADPQADRSAQGTELARVFGLTGAEARLLMGLVEGRSLQECAAAAGISVQTARSQLKRIFDKTGERRQSDLIRLVLTNPVVARARPCED